MNHGTGRRSTARRILLALLICLVIGLTLFFTAWLLSTTGWIPRVLAWIEDLRPA